MGLDVSHNAWSGAYSAFNSLRRTICEAMGGKWPSSFNSDDGFWYWGDGYTRETHPGLFVFLSHSDCDGEISPDDCTKVADDLEALLPRIAATAEEPALSGFVMEKNGDGFVGRRTPGHIDRAGGYVGATRQFIAGCREAARLREPLRFF